MKTMTRMTTTKQKEVKITKSPKKRLHRPNNKDAIYEVFKTWLAIPDVLRGLDPERAEKMGGNAFNSELMSIKTHGEFAQKYDIGRETLTDWKKRAIKEGSVREAVEVTAKQYLPNLMHGFYLHTMKNGDAPRMKLWLEWIERWIAPKEDEDKPLDTPVVLILNGAEYMRSLPPPTGIDLSKP